MGSREPPKDRPSGCARKELLYAVAALFGREMPKHCKQNVVQYVLRPMIKRQLRAGKPYFRLGNLVVTATPGECLAVGKSQLFKHMREVASAAPWLDEVYGVIVTDDAHAEYYTLQKGGEPELKAEGDPGEVVAAALATLCAGKIPVVGPEDIAIVFGIQT
jgi:hypothetical protein